MYDANGQPGPFRWLVNLKYGDLVIVHANGQKYTYQVQTSQPEVAVSELYKVFRHEDLPWLTLITCRGYDVKTDTYLWRSVVRAVLMFTGVDQ